ncbi:MAG: hypothetical protein VB131_08090 [Burkholderia gladioli]
MDVVDTSRSTSIASQRRRMRAACDNPRFAAHPVQSVAGTAGRLGTTARRTLAGRAERARHRQRIRTPRRT